MWRYLALALCLAACTRAQNIPPLPGQNTPPVLVGHPTPIGGNGPDASCKDTIENCRLFGEASCKAPYEDWAKKNCALTCKFCVAPPTSPPPCVDKLDNCADYLQNVCDEANFTIWAEENCRRRCRKCTKDQLIFIDQHPSTIAPDQCIDKLDCRLYGKSSCTGEFLGWATTNCPEYCGICTGIPKPPAKCIDTNPDCMRYDKTICSNPAYHIWAEDNCMQFCGFCGGGPTTSGPMTPPPLPQISTHGFPTPPPLSVG